MAENQELEEDLIVDIQEDPQGNQEEEVISSSFPVIPEFTPRRYEQTWPEYRQHLAELYDDDDARYRQAVMPRPDEKITIDYDRMLRTLNPTTGENYNTSDIAKFLIEHPINFGDRFGPGAYQAFVDQGFSDNRLIDAFSNVRSVGKINAAFEEWAKGVVTMSPAVTGGVVGAQINPWLSVPGMITGWLFGDQLMKRVAPEIYGVRARSDRAAAAVGMIVGGSGPARHVPSLMAIEGPSWLTNSYIQPMNRLNLGADFVKSRMDNWFSRGVGRLQDWSGTAITSAQRNPRAFAAAEIGQTWAAATAGWAAERGLPLGMPYRPGAQIAIEMAAAITDPRSLAIRKIPMVADFSTYLGRLFTFNVDGRTTRAGQRYNEMLLKWAEPHDQAYKAKLDALNEKYPATTYMEADSTFGRFGRRPRERTVRENEELYNEELAVIQRDYIQAAIDAVSGGTGAGFSIAQQRAKLAKENIPDSERTAGIVSGIPFFYALESRIAPFAGSNQKISTAVAETQEYINNALRLSRIRMARTMRGLVDEGTPEALSELARIRRDYSEMEIQKIMDEALTAYQNNVARATAAGETMDTGAYLHRLFFDRDGPSVLSAINDEAKNLKAAIPAMEGVNLNPLVDAYNEINDLYRIAAQTPRLSHGSDLVSIDHALDQYKQVLKRGDVPDLPVELTAAARLDLDQKKLNLRKAEEALETENAKGRYPGEGRAIFDRSEYTSRETVEQLELNRKKIENEIFEIEHPVAVIPMTFDGEDITANSRQIVNFVSVIDTRMHEAIRQGDNNVIDILQRLRTGAMESLGKSALPAAQLYHTFDQSSRAMFANNFLGELRYDIQPELIGSQFFKGVGDKVYARMVQMDNVLKYLEANSISPPDINYEQMTDNTLTALMNRRNRQQQELGTVDVSTPGTVRQLQEIMLNGMLDNPAYFRTVQRVDLDGMPMYENGDTPVMMKEATENVATFIQENSDLLDNFLPDAKQILSDTQQTAAYYKMQQAKIKQRRDEANDAFQQAFEGRFTNAAAGIQKLAGTPDTRELDPSLLDPVNDLKDIIQTAKNTTVKVGGRSVDVGKELHRVLMDHALTYSKAGQLNAPGSESLFNADLFRRYWQEPLTSGGPSLERLLRDGGILTDDVVLGQQKLWRLWDEINLMNKATETRRLELAPGPQGFLTQPREENLASGVERLLVSVGGSVIGSSIRDLFSYLPLLRGGAGGLIAASEGATFLRNRLINAPDIVKGDMFLTLNREPDLLAAVMQEGLNAEGVPIKPTPKSIRALYTWLGGVGLMPATVSRDDFAEMWERENPGLEYQDPGGTTPTRSPNVFSAPSRAGPSRAEELNRLYNRQPPEEVVVEEAEEVDLSPAVGFTPPPMPPLTMPQGQASTGQAPPPTNQGAYAAAFPFDSVSEVIRSRQGRQGIGSLG